MNKGFSFFTSLPTLAIFWYCFCFQVIAILIGLEVVSHVVLTCIFLMFSDVKHLSMCFLAICIMFGKLFKFFGHFLKEFFFSFWVIEILYIFSMLFSFKIYNLQMFSSNLWVAFLFCWYYHKVSNSDRIKLLFFFFSLVGCTFGVIFKESWQYPMS